MKSLVAAYKFDRKKRIAPVLAGILFDRCRDIISEADLVTSVPLSARKKWKRGFNQSGVVARMVAGRAGIRYAELLREQGISRKQKTLGFGERFFNVMGRYAVKSGVSLEQTPSVLIVDDVFTTGATVNECARILRNAGARRVFSVTMARVDIKKLEK
jgi:ComF family protein